jgi:1-phosphatidylinositol-3-phosphate 5-kinase
MLTLPVRVGFCEGFEVKTYIDIDYLGRKKTYIFLSGCDPSIGGAIALRGTTRSFLSKIKRIMDFMVYVVYNLKLETCLMRDEFLDYSNDMNDNLPSLIYRQANDDIVKSIDSSARSALSSMLNQTSAAKTIGTTQRVLPTQNGVNILQDSLTPTPNGDVPMPTFYSDVVARYETKILSASPLVNFRPPYLLMKVREQEYRLMYLKRVRDEDMVGQEQEDIDNAGPQPFQLVKPEMIHTVGHRGPKQIMEIIHAVHDAAYDEALHSYQTYTRQWDNYIKGSLDLFDPYSHQNIVVLYSVICTETKIPCIEPGLLAIGFYDEQHVDTDINPDCTLGQYLENLWYRKDDICSAYGCNKPLSEHHHTYVHGESRVTIILESTPPKPAIANSRDEINMWSYCKIYDKDLPATPMSESTWKYSFGKYLELLIWSNHLRLNNQVGCSHNHKRDHIRYFAFLDIKVRIHYDPIDLLEVITPRPRITWIVKHDLNLKNDIFMEIEDRWNRFIVSVKSRLESIRIDAVLPEKVEACKADVERLTKKAQDDHDTLIHRLQDIYINSKYYEVIPFNAIIQEMLQYAGEWDGAFAKFESDFLPDKDVRLLTVLQLKKMFFNNEPKEALLVVESNASAVSKEERPSQTLIELEERPTQLIDPMDPSSVENATLPKVTKEAGISIPIVPAEGATDQVDVLDLGTSVSPPIIPSPYSLAVSATSTQLCREQSKSSSGVELSAPKLLSSQQDTSHHQVELAQFKSSLQEKSDPLKREEQTPAERLLTLATITDGSENSKGNSHKARPTLTSPTAPRPTPRLTRQLSNKLHSTEGKELKKGDIGTNEAFPEGTMKSDKKRSDRLGTSFKNRKPGQSAIPRFVHKRETRVSILSRQFEQLSKEFEHQRIEDREKRAEKLRQRQPRMMLPHSSTKAVVKVYNDIDEAVQEPGLSDYDLKLDQETDTPAEGPQPPTPSAEVVPTLAEEKAESHLTAETAAEGDTNHNAILQSRHGGSDEDGGGASLPESSLNDFLPGIRELTNSLEPSSDDIPKHQKFSLLKMLTNFWAERSSSGWQPLDYPVNVTDHFFIDSDVIVREDEPSSLIAFALNSEDYQARVAHIGHQSHLQIQKDYEEGEARFKLSASERMDQYVDEEVEKSLFPGTATHLTYQFTEGSAKMLCKIFYAEQFEAIRRKTGVAGRIVESLSRCLKWDSQGGKSRAVFLKTLDDRFVLKSLSAAETAAFLSFAPAYFNMIAESLFHELPSVNAKLVGFFQISIKNPVTNIDIKLDVLVMENLFYGMSPSRIFDLKGSMRNRKIQPTGQHNEVLLDENMVEFIHESPLFIREHSKKLLQLSVWNDTLFLARQNVMDYSLLVTIDEVKKELVVGIVDFIRTYTLDKRLESWIKDRGFTGGGGNRPTITKPKEYKSRFREAMKRWKDTSRLSTFRTSIANTVARYILQAPDCWHQFALPDPGS